MTEDASFAELFRAIVREHPDRGAVRADDVELTYAELDAGSNRVAHTILERRSAPDEPIGLLLGHGGRAVLAMVGALKSGTPFVPLDAREPIERLQMLHELGRLTLTVTDREHRETAARLTGDPVLVDELEQTDNRDLGIEPPSRSPAVVFFTSGSTGEPKGVVHSLANEVHKGRALAAAHHLTPADRVGLTASLAFGASSARMLGALLSGATLCCYDVHRRGVRELEGWATSNGVTVLSLVPALLRAVSEQAPGPPMTSVRLLLSGGEALLGRDVLNARPRFGGTTVFSNRLSSTETYVIAEHSIGPNDTVDDGPLPCGRAVPGIEVRILDADGAPVPDGDAGQLVVLGHHLALGYWRDPDLTASRFFEASDGRRGFRTDDLVRRRPDGLLVHAGRTDDRVKVRGAMVHTLEIEAALRARDDVVDVAVVPTTSGGAGTTLTAYVVPAPMAPPSVRELRRDLGRRLPARLLPNAFLLVAALPRTDRGKLDRTALPPAQFSRPAYRPPGTQHERAVADAFAVALGIEHVGLDDDFFDLGGDSLAALELLAAVHDHFGIDVSLTALLDASTVERLALHVADRRGNPTAAVVPLRRGGTGQPFFCASGVGVPALGLRRVAAASDPIRPWYGMQMHGLETPARPDRSLEAIARRVLVEVRGIQPAGPYLLGGHSSGALLAFEIGRQLRAAGDEVALLVIIDGHGPRSRVDRLSTRLEVVQRDRPRTAGGIAATATNAVRWVAASVSARVRFRIRSWTAGTRPRDPARRYELFTFLGRWLARRYRPTGAFDGRAVIVHCSGTNAVPDSWTTSHLTGPVDVVAVAGDHRSMLRDPYAAELAVEIDRAIAALSTAK